MSQRQPNVGELVMMQAVASTEGATQEFYRIEQLLDVPDGARLYKIRCDAEPFARIVSDVDFIQS